jgi:hypothetical protein
MDPVFKIFLCVCRKNMGMKQILSELLFHQDIYSPNLIFITILILKSAIIHTEGFWMNTIGGVMRFIKRRIRQNKRDLMIEEMKLRAFYESNIRKLDKMLELQFGKRKINNPESEQKISG